VGLSAAVAIAVGVGAGDAEVALTTFAATAIPANESTRTPTNRIPRCSAVMPVEAAGSDTGTDYVAASVRRIQLPPDYRNEANSWHPRYMQYRSIIN